MTTRIDTEALARPTAPFAVIIALVLLGAAVAVPVVIWMSTDSENTAADSEAPKEVQALRGIHYSPPRSAPEIEAVDHNGKPFTLSRQPHPLSMVFFGYVSCTDVCPTNLKKFEKIQEALGREADQIQFVFVSIAPEHEPPKVMREYLSEYFGGEIIGVTAEEPGRLKPVYDKWGIVREKVELEEPVMGRDYKYDHTGQIFLVQGGDTIPVSYPYGTSVETMVEDLRALLKDPSLGERLPEVGEVKEVEIEPGTFTRASQDNPTLPSYVRVRMGDSIRWKNNDYMYHFIGDISLAPGESATQTFNEAGTFYYGCTAVPSEVVRISVEES